MEIPSVLATLPTKEFVAYLKRNGVEPTKDEQVSAGGLVGTVNMNEGIAYTLKSGQMDGWALGETSAK